MSIFIPLDIAIFFIITMLLRSQFQSYVNYASFFSGIWIFIISISRLGLYDTYVPSHLTYIIMYITLFVFILTTYYLRSYKRKKIIYFERKTVLNRLNLSCINYSPLVFLAIIVLSILVTYLPEALSILAKGGFSSVRHNVLYSETSTYSSASLVFLKWAVNPLILAEFMVSFSALALRRVNRKKTLPILVLILSLVNLTIYTLVFAGRWLLMEAILFSVFLLLYKYGFQLWKLIYNNKLITALGVIAIGAMLSISNDRSIGDNNLFTSLYVYFVGAVDMLDVLITDYDYSQLGDILFGTYTLDGLLSPFYVVSNRLFGTHIPLAINRINSVTSTMVSISPELHMNNNCTYVYGVLRDFGVVGLLIGPMILAVVCHVICKYFENKRNDFGLILYLYMMIVLFFMVIEWMFGRVNVIYTGIFLYLIMRLCCVKKLYYNTCQSY